MAGSKVNRQVLKEIEQRQLRMDLPEFRVGDRIKVHIRISEGGKERIQVFQGDVIKKTRGDIRAAFTVRKVSYGIGVERSFPLHSPQIQKIEIVQHGKVRRNRLFYLRGLRGKATRIAERANKESKEGA